MKGHQVGTVPRALAELRRGRPVLVADSADRENEVDVVLPARDVDPSWVAWTIRHTSGYLCAPMPASRADHLDLPLMVPTGQDPFGTAYTITVDAARGVTTGISAADRARTLDALADPVTTPGDLSRPGHVVPLRAACGGVLRRAGHTEATVDLIRMAGLGEVGAIAELVEDDGAMVRLDQAAQLAERASLVLLTIEDLIEWRAEHDPAPPPLPAPARVRRTGTAMLPTSRGRFRSIGYQDRATGADHLALLPVVVGPGANTARSPAGTHPRPAPLVRVHSECLTGEALGALRCDCGPQLQLAMQQIAADGGAVIYLRGHEGRGIGLRGKLDAYALQDAGRDTVQANLDLGWPADGRDYRAAAAILAELGLDRIQLLTNNPAKTAALRAEGIDVVRTRSLRVGHNSQNARYLHTKQHLLGHDLELEKP